MRRLVKRKKKTRRAVKESEVGTEKAVQMKTKKAPRKSTRKKKKFLITL